MIRAKEIPHESNCCDYGWRAWRTLLAEEPCQLSEAIPLAHQRRGHNDSKDGEASAAAGFHGGHFRGHQREVCRTGAGTAAGTAGGEHPAGAVCQKYSTLYRSGCRCDPQEVRRGNDAGAALRPPHPLRGDVCGRAPSGSRCGRAGRESGDHRHHPLLSGDRLRLYQV